MGSLARYDIENNLSMRIINAALSVYHHLGGEKTEDYYRKALVNMLKQEKLDIQEDFPVDVWQNGELADLYFLDLFVDWKVIVRILAVRQPFQAQDREQMLDYLAAANARMGILINFGRRAFDFERLLPANPLSYE